MRNFNKPEKLTDKDKALLRYVDNVKNDDPATMQMIRDYNPYEKKNKQSPDVYEISEELNKFRAKNDKLPTYNSNEPKYNSALGKFELNGKSGPLSDFVKPGEKLPRVDFGLDKPQLFQDTLKNVQRKGKRANKMNDIDLIFSAADPKEKWKCERIISHMILLKENSKLILLKRNIKTPITKPAPAPLNLLSTR